MWRRCAVVTVLGTAIFIGCGVDVTGQPDAGADAGAAIDAGSTLPLIDTGIADTATPDSADADTGFAQLHIVVSVDGRSDLIIQNNVMKWHHIEYSPPGITTINGVAWQPMWTKGQPVDCECDSTPTTIAPPLPARAQTVGFKENVARRDVDVVHPSDANGYTLTLRFDDNVSGAETYDVTVVYATR